MVALIADHSAPSPPLSITAQVILRGTRSAGYGFVALKSEAAVAKAVELLDKKELDGRPVIVAPAKSESEKEKKPKAAKKRSNRRGDKAVPGEVTEAEANGETADKPAEGAVALITDETPKSKKKKPAVRPKAPFTFAISISPFFSCSARTRRRRLRVMRRLSPHLRPPTLPPPPLRRRRKSQRSRGSRGR
jgi:RNA recognition motif-containing protein